MRPHLIFAAALSSGLLASASGCSSFGGAGSGAGKASSGDMVIVFSKAPITGDSLDKSDPALTTDFEVGDPIYARFYTVGGAGIASHQSEPGSPVAFVMLYHDIDGRDYDDSYQVTLGGDELQKNYADVDVFVEGAPRQALRVE